MAINEAPPNPGLMVLLDGASGQIYVKMKLDEVNYSTAEKNEYIIMVCVISQIRMYTIDVTLTLSYGTVSYTLW